MEKFVAPTPSYAFFIIFLGGSIPQHSTEIEILSFCDLWLQILECELDLSCNKILVE